MDGRWMGWTDRRTDGRTEGGAGLSGPWLEQRGAPLASETRVGGPVLGLPSGASGLGGDGRKPSIQTPWSAGLGPQFCPSSLSHRNPT